MSKTIWVEGFVGIKVLETRTCRYLAAKSEADHYTRELKREQEEIIAVPDTGDLNLLKLSFCLIDKVSYSGIRDLRFEFCLR